FDQSVESLIDLALPATRDFMVVTFDIESALDHSGDHFAAEVLVMICGRNGEIPFLVPGAIPQIVVLSARVPPSLFRVYVVKPAVLVLVKANVIENEKLGFCPKKRSIGKATVLEM